MVPDSLLRAGTANTEMRAKFEKMIREAQNFICSSVEEVDGCVCSALSLS